MQPKGAHPGGVAVSVLLLVLLRLSLPLLVNVAEGARPGVLVLCLCCNGL